MPSFGKMLLAVAAGVLLLSAAQSTTAKKTARKTTARPTASAKTAPSKKSAARKTAPRMAPSAKTAAATSKKPVSRKTVATRRRATPARKPAVTWRSRQMQPTPDRYKQIQQALASKGYLTGEPTGVWDQQSVDALRRFQGDQKLDATGKIDSLSLIALGLGPKHETAAVQPAVPATTN